MDSQDSWHGFPVLRRPSHTSRKLLKSEGLGSFKEEDLIKGEGIILLGPVCVMELHFNQIYMLFVNKGWKFIANFSWEGVI